MEKQSFEADVCVVGGAGHVGLPLAIAFAAAGLRVIAYDLNEEALATVGRGEMPFIEYDAEPLLKQVVGKRLLLSSELSSVGKARFVVLAIGTPVDEYLNPTLRSLLELVGTLQDHLVPEQTLIIRSTVYPHTTRQVLRRLEERDGDWHVAYCPERIAQGYAIRELATLPQIVSGTSDRAVEEASALFGRLTEKLIEVPIEEAELAKLFSNAWRYIQFATTNQFYMIACEMGADYDRVRRAMTEGYGRAATLPSAGFAAGPCLLKDTMQLAAFNRNNFMLGHAAMMINEGLPGFIVDQLSRSTDLSTRTVGILGMAFKADIDDPRDSLSYKLGKILRFQGANVLYSDEFVADPTFIPADELIAKSDIVIIGVPHSAYLAMDFPDHCQVVDPWGSVRSGGS